VLGAYFSGAVTRQSPATLAYVSTRQLSGRLHFFRINLTNWIGISVQLQLRRKPDLLGAHPGVGDDQR
jgi:hypothetical protein